MAKTTGPTVASLVVMCLVGATRPVDAASGVGAAIQRVRSSQPSIVGLIREATNQSKTFRSLVDAINDTDGIVYIEEGKCGRGVRACLVNVTLAGAQRMLWIKVDTRNADRDLLASIGHELRHTLEVLGDRKVTDSASMYMFYLHGLGLGVVTTGTQDTFETRAAIGAGDAVRNELRNYRPPISAPRLPSSTY